MPDSSPQPQPPPLVATLVELVRAHRELCELLERQQAAMREIDLDAMAGVSKRQEQLHRRILRLERERRANAALLASSAGLPGDASLGQIAEKLPVWSEQLLALRQELRGLSREASDRGKRAGRIAASVLCSVGSALRSVTGSTLYRRGGDFSLPPLAHRVDRAG
jgi:hypothetical protein